MAASRGWVPVFVLAVTTLIACGEDGKLEDSLPSACRLEPPELSRAVRMECDFSNNSARLHAGQLPSSIQTIRMSNAEEIVIDNDTFSSCQSLKSIHLHDIETLQIYKNTWTRIEQPEQVTITIAFVSDLFLHTGAFSDQVPRTRGDPVPRSYPGPKINITDVTRYHISRNAFHSDTVIQSVVLQTIGNLTVEKFAFQADVDQLELVNVSQVTGCQKHSFGGRIKNLSLLSVNITEVRTRCLDADLGSLIVRSSYLGNIQDKGITGTVNDVVIEDSRLGNVTSHGLYLNASTFTMYSTMVEVLATDSLGVTFNQSASLQRSTINSLQANAFRLFKPRAGGGGRLIVEQVSVGEAENGSLAFSKQTQVTLLDVVLRDPCECDVDKRALRLVVGDAPPRDATDEHQRAARQIVYQVRCTAGTDTMTLAEFDCQNCSAKDGNIAQCFPTLQNRTAGVWVLPVGAGTPQLLLLLLMLLALGAAVTTVKRRRSRQEEEHPLADQLRSNGRAQDVTQEPENRDVDAPVLPRPPSSVFFERTLRSVPGFSRMLQYVQPDNHHSSSALRAPSSEGHPHALQSELRYSEVFAPALLRPPSPGYLEMTPRSARIPGQPVDMGCDAVAADKQQNRSVDCAARKGMGRERVVYTNLHELQHHEER